ncbi:MAG: aspartate aminotransferase [Desulfobulbus propionicus]|nr:MAG: aspartate aminotransferase [Desulfobulbus propionicus]
MDPVFAERIAAVPKSFIREILKVTLRPEIISFAGGLPNRDLFPVAALQRAASQIFAEAGQDILQYASSEGYLPLREYIAERYRSHQGLVVAADNILITTGSQQGLDLLGKVLVNEGDGVAIEEPGYLGAIQAFALYRPRFLPIPLTDEGLEVERLAVALQDQCPKLLYTVANFQNPAGISSTEANRRQVAAILADSGCWLIQDDPYGELRFSGTPAPSFASLLPDQTVLLGSFSKTVAPGLRLGWLVAPPHLMAKLLIAKQAADLHSDTLAQRLLHRFLLDNDLDQHIATITEVYGRQKAAMVEALAMYLPGIHHTNPDGGMFLWLTLPQSRSAMDLFHRAIDGNVAFVPGAPFYTRKAGDNTLRLNFSCVDTATIAEGIRRLAAAYDATT